MPRVPLARLTLVKEPHVSAPERYAGPVPPSTPRVKAQARERAAAELLRRAAFLAEDAEQLTSLGELHASGERLSRALACLDWARALLGDRA